jgi:hypothetical protein
MASMPPECDRSGRADTRIGHRAQDDAWDECLVAEDGTRADPLAADYGRRWRDSATRRCVGTSSAAGSYRRSLAEARSVAPAGKEGWAMTRAAARCARQYPLRSRIDVAGLDEVDAAQARRRRVETKRSSPARALPRCRPTPRGGRRAAAHDPNRDKAPASSLGLMNGGSAIRSSATDAPRQVKRSRDQDGLKDYPS